MSDYTPTPKLPDFFAPKPMSGALTYTPTTEKVRKGYAGALYLSEIPRDRSEEFDRWLAEVKAQAWEEGFTHNVGDSSWNSLYDNPYRQGEEQ